MVHFVAETCLQVSVFILVQDWKKSRRFLLNYINLFKVSFSLLFVTIYFMYFICKSKLLWIPKTFSSLSESQVVLSVHKRSVMC